jgi:hypothetical protein
MSFCLRRKREQVAKVIGDDVTSQLVLLSKALCGASYFQICCAVVLQAIALQQM